MGKWNGELRFLMALFEEWQEEAERWRYPYLEIELGDMDLVFAQEWVEALFQEGYEAVLAFSKPKDALFLLVAGWDRYFHLPDLGVTPMNFSKFSEIETVMEDFAAMFLQEQVLVKDRLAR